jgi:hypothetical protein
VCHADVTQPHERQGLPVGEFAVDVGELPAVADVQPGELGPVCPGVGDQALRLASVRGYSHRYHGIPRQDAADIAYETHSGAVVFAVADGVSSAAYPHIGAGARRAGPPST